MAIVSITLADAQATPVIHTFVPQGWQGDTFWWNDTAQANAVGYWRISMKFQQPPPPTGAQSSKDRVYRVTVGLHEPVLETVSNSTISGIAPAPTISYVLRGITEYVLPERSTLLDRQNTRKMSANLQANAQIVQVVETLVNLYG